MAESKFPKSPWQVKAQKRMEDRNMLDFSFSIAVRILTLMKKKGINQKELAEELSVTPQYLSHYLKGKSMPNFRLIEKASQYFGERIITVAKDEPLVKTRIKAKEYLKPYISNNLGNEGLQLDWSQKLWNNKKGIQYTPNC